MPLDTGAGHYVAGPVIAIVVVCLLAVLARWVAGTGRSRPTGRALPLPAADHGLLRPIAELPDRAAGAALRAVLSEAGIRSTLGARRDGSVQVLVFPEDEARARRLVPPAA